MNLNTKEPIVLLAEMTVDKHHEAVNRHHYKGRCERYKAVSSGVLAFKT
jgi:hypothetical protein